MKLLISRKDSIKVTVYCYEDKDGEIETSHLKSEVPQDVDVVEQLELEFRKPNYADSNAIIRMADLKTEGEDTKLNFSSFQEAILKTLLVDWDLKNEEGERISLNSANINALHPNVARAAVGAALEKIRI